MTTCNKLSGDLGISEEREMQIFIPDYKDVLAFFVIAGN